VNGQLTVTTLPDILFLSNSGDCSTVCDLAVLHCWFSNYNSEYHLDKKWSDSCQWPSPYSHQEQ